MTSRTIRPQGYANRTPWQEAIQEVPVAWLEDEAKRSTSPYSLLASWKGPRGGVPSHVMIKLLRRRISEDHPELLRTVLPPGRLQRTEDMLKGIWAKTGEANGKHPVWRLVESLIRLAWEHLGGDRVDPSQPGQGD